jgi:hypothetical protein
LVSIEASTDIPERERPINVWRGIKNDFHRNALHEFGEIPSRVVRRQQAERKSARGGHAVDIPV